jgi:hypothetical protein
MLSRREREKNVEKSPPPPHGRAWDWRPLTGFLPVALAVEASGDYNSIMGDR